MVSSVWRNETNETEQEEREKLLNAERTYERMLLPFHALNETTFCDGMELLKAGASPACPQGGFLSSWIQDASDNSGFW